MFCIPLAKMDIGVLTQIYLPLVFIAAIFTLVGFEVLPTVGYNAL
jgi:hypothetical protein